MTIRTDCGLRGTSDSASRSANVPTPMKGNAARLSRPSRLIGRSGRWSLSGMMLGRPPM